MPITIRLPPLEEVARRWGEIEPPLKLATDRTDGCFAPIHVLQDIMAGRKALWLVEDAGAVIGVTVGGREDYPTGKRVWQVPYIGGERAEEWYPAIIAEMEARARALGCHGMNATGRPGWERFSRRAGIALKPVATIYAREL